MEGLWPHGPPLACLHDGHSLPRDRPRHAVVAEYLNYSAAGLRAIVPKYCTVAQAASYAPKPGKIVNRAYAYRIGNGSEASGDGWRNLGRGLVQITGRDNYRTYGIEGALNTALEPKTAIRIMFDGMTMAASPARN